jgi:hypothetical protein
LKTAVDLSHSKTVPEWLWDEREACRNDIARFNHVVLGRPKLWSKQAQLCKSFIEKPVTLCQSGNSTGKSFVVASIALHYLTYHPNSKIILTASSETQLREVCWAYITKAFSECPYRLFPKARLYKQPLKLEIAEDWFILAYSTKKAERLSGHHAEHLAFIVDEASGVEREIFEALDSLAPHRTLLIGNPLRPEGVFYERCKKQEIEPDSKVNLIKIKSSETPDATTERSARGLASAGWLKQMEREWGKNSQWWKSHIDAEFPESDGENLIPLPWLERCEMPHRPYGPKRIAIDLATGTGGDSSVVICADSGGIIEWWKSNTASMEETAWKAFEMKRKHDVSDHRITWDAQGVGADFAFRLKTVGIGNPTPYKSARMIGNDYFLNHRAISFWRFRQRLDFSGEHYIPFSMPSNMINELKREIGSIFYTTNSQGKIVITPKEELVKLLGRSPDLSDACSQLFSYLD